MRGRILVIDDKVMVCKSLAQNFEQRGYQTLYATTGAEALHLFATEPIHAVLLDIMLGKENGLHLLADLLQIHNTIPIIMMTGYASIETAVQAMKSGAFDYITKPLDFDKLFPLVERAVDLAKLNTEQHSETLMLPSTSMVITQHAPLLNVCQRARKLAATDLPILIVGENGVGKELIADLIHAHSARHAHPMLKINCAAFPETLLDNELFGHEKGAYTGADTTFKGVFERAHGSSLFLDEIGDMPLTIQAKILRGLQHHEIRRLGGERMIKVDVRFIAATNKDLPALIAQKTFREDLFYRLNAAMLHIPPLRDRKEDIPLLVEHFLKEYAATHAASSKRLSDAVLECFLDYAWPGNVRELKNTLNYAAAISTSDVIECEDLPPHFPVAGQLPQSENIREDVEKTLIMKMLHKAHYNKTKAAELLNMSRKTLYNKLEKYGITLPK